MTNTEQDGCPEVRVHHLVAIMGGECPHDVFDPDTVIHHKNEVKWDNRPDNLECMTRSGHAKHHAEKRSQPL